VIALFAIKRKSGRLGVHVLLPLLGIITIGAVITQMSSIGLTVGLAWLGIGVLVAVALRMRGKTL